MDNELDKMTMVDSLDFLLDYAKLNEEKHLLQSKFNFYISLLILMGILSPINMIIEVKLPILVVLGICFGWVYVDYLNCRAKVEKIEKEFYKKLQESKNATDS